MKKVRQVIAYKDHFEIFLKNQTLKVQDKIYKVIEIIETYEHVPSKYLKSVADSDGLFEARIRLASNIWRVFCFLDEGKLVILLSGFQKKTQKTPRKELKKAMKLMNDYFEEKRKST